MSDTGEIKSFDANEVLSAATRNFGLLEMSLFSLARIVLSLDSYAYAKNLTFTNCAKVLQVVIREKNQGGYQSKIDILEQAITLYKHRNRIFHNPVIPNVAITGDASSIQYGLLNTKTGEYIDGYDLERINTLAVEANLLSGRLSELINDA